MNKYLKLMRFDKPIGIYLLAYPTIWALLLANNGLPKIKILLIFIIGIIIMRSSGCIINDFADRNIDKLVKRTKNRPITTGEISPQSALIVFILLIFIAFILILQTNLLTIQLAIIAVCLTIFYPFSKRFFVMPQLFLALAFSMSVLMSFSASINYIPLNAYLIFIANIIWTIIYDTMYAMSDKSDDLKIGINSSAIFFDKYDKLILKILQVLLLVLLALIGISFKLNIYYYLSLLIIIIIMLYHQHLIKNNNKELCFKAFLHNNYLGLTVFFGIVLGIML